MVYQILLRFVSLILDLVATTGVADSEKDLEIALLRQQIRVLERKSKQQTWLSKPVKLMLVVLAKKLKAKSGRFRDQLSECLLLVKPDTLLRWHCDLVRGKLTFKHAKAEGRPCLDVELEDLIIRLARENPRMGYDKIQRELLKLGYKVDPTTVRNIMRRHHLLPAPRRGHSSWRTFLKHYRQQMLACDFFTVETIRLQTIYVLFFIEIGSRRVHLAGCTAAPDTAWVTQQARNFIWHLNETNQPPTHFLIHDHDTKFSAAFDTIFVTQNVEIVLTPIQTPTANAVAECWVRSLREECLDELLIINEAHLRRVLTEYIAYFNMARPHQGINQQIPVPSRSPQEGTIHCRDVLGGIIHDYYRQAA